MSSRRLRASAALASGGRVIDIEPVVLIVAGQRKIAIGPPIRRDRDFLEDFSCLSIQTNIPEPCRRFTDIARVEYEHAFQQSIVFAFVAPVSVSDDPWAVRRPVAGVGRGVGCVGAHHLRGSPGSVRRLRRGMAASVSNLLILSEGAKVWNRRSAVGGQRRGVWAKMPQLSRSLSSSYRAPSRQVFNRFKA